MNLSITANGLELGSAIGPGMFHLLFYLAKEKMMTPSQSMRGARKESFWN